MREILANNVAEDSNFDIIIDNLLSEAHQRGIEHLMEANKLVEEHFGKTTPSGREKVSHPDSHEESRK